jgi:hypothetical protein
MPLVCLNPAATVLEKRLTNARNTLLPGRDVAQEKNEQNKMGVFLLVRGGKATTLPEANLEDCSFRHFSSDRVLQPRGGHAQKRSSVRVIQLRFQDED